MTTSFSLAVEAFFRITPTLFTLFILGACWIYPTLSYAETTLAPTQVYLGDTAYTVTDHQATHNGEPLTGVSARLLVSLTSAATRARVSPILGLAGTNTHALRTATQILNDTQTQLLALQTSKDNEAAVRHLFPISFLESLAEAEDARITFAQHPSWPTFFAYIRRLNEAVTRYQSDLLRFRHAFAHVVPKDTHSFAATSVMISYDTLAQTQEDLMMHAWELRRQVQKEFWCTVTSLCTPTRTPLTPIAHKSETPTATQLARAEFARELFMATHDEARAHMIRSQLFILDHADCIPETSTTPPYFIAATGNKTAASLNDPRSLSVLYAGNVRFIETSGGRTIPFTEHYRKLGISYIPVVENTYYECPFAARDQTRVLFLVDLLDMITNMPLSAQITDKALARDLKEIETTLINGPTTEHDARGYIELALAHSDAFPSETQHLLQDTLYAFMYHSNNLEDVVGDVAFITERLLRRTDSGTPLDLSAPTLFMLRSGFTLLYLSHHGDTAPLSRFEARPKGLNDPFVYVSEIVPQKISQKELLETRRHYFNPRGN